MCFCTFIQSVWIDFFDNITEERDKGDAQYSTSLSFREPFAVTGSCMRQTCERIHTANHSCNL